MINELLVITGIFLILESIILMILLRDINYKDKEIKELMNVIKIKNIQKFKGE